MMKLSIVFVLGVVVLATAKTIPTAENEIPHEEKIMETVHDENTDSDVKKRYTYEPTEKYTYDEPWDVRVPHKYFELNKNMRGNVPETSMKFGKHIDVGGKKGISIDFSRDDGGISKSVKFSSGSDSHQYDTDRETVRPYYYPGKYLQYRQNYSPYDFTSKVNERFDTMNQYRYGNMDHRYTTDASTYGKSFKKNKSTDAEHEQYIDSHDSSINKRSSFDFTPDYYRTDIGSEYYPYVNAYSHYGYPTGFPTTGLNQYTYGKGYPITHSTYQNVGYGGQTYGRGFPSYQGYPYQYGMNYGTPYGHDTPYGQGYMNPEDMDMKAKELKDWLKKYEESKKLKKSSKKDKYDYPSYPSEHMTVPEIPTFGRMY